VQLLKIETTKHHYVGMAHNGNKTFKHATYEKKIREQMPKAEAFVCFGALADKFNMGFSFL
jgi:hypothetical protein